MGTNAAGVVDVLDDASRHVQDLLKYSQLLGADPFLVLHGGGNTSVKDAHYLRVKASGHDLAHLTAAGIPPLRRSTLEQLLDRPTLTDTEMIDGYQAALLHSGAPSPSIEALLHNLLPYRFVLHTHADAIVTLTNTVHGAQPVFDALGQDILFLPFSMPGFELAKLVQRAWDELDGRPIRGIVLAHHGLFTFADDAREAYSQHMELIENARRFIHERAGVNLSMQNPPGGTSSPLPPDFAHFRSDYEALTGFAVEGQLLSSPEIEAFLARADLASITQRGPSTLEHVIHTKRIPLIGIDRVESYAEDYRTYFNTYSARAQSPLEMLDPAPRVILDSRHGLLAIGASPQRVIVARDIYQHTLRNITAAEALGGYQSITPAQAFDVEYWELEQAKLR